MKKKESKTNVKKVTKKTPYISTNKKVKTQVNVKDKGVQTIQEKVPKLFYTNDLQKCRSSLNRLLNMLNENSSKVNIQKIRAQTYIIKSIADIFIAEKQILIESRLDDLERSIDYGSSIANGKEALL